MLKNIVLFFLLTSVILCAICGCSTNSLTSSKNSDVASSELTSSKDENDRVPTISAKDMSSQEFVDFVEKEVTIINLPDNFKFIGGEIEYIYNQSSLEGNQIIDFILFGSLSIEQKNTFVEKLNTATWENLGVFWYKEVLENKIRYYKTLKDEKKRTNEQVMDSADGKVSCYTRYVSYKSIYGYHTQLGISIYVFKENSKSYKIIINGQTTNKNAIEGMLEIQPDGSAKVKN